jgi:hypothetical protein
MLVGTTDQPVETAGNNSATNAGLLPTCGDRRSMIGREDLSKIVDTAQTGLPGIAKDAIETRPSG